MGHHDQALASCDANLPAGWGGCCANQRDFYYDLFALRACGNFDFILAVVRLARACRAATHRPPRAARHGIAPRDTPSWSPHLADAGWSFAIRCCDQTIML